MNRRSLSKINSIHHSETSYRFINIPKIFIIPSIAVHNYQVMKNVPFFHFATTHHIFLHIYKLTPVLVWKITNLSNYSHSH